jgi:hypothetical protein
MQVLKKLKLRFNQSRISIPTFHTRIFGALLQLSLLKLWVDLKLHGELDVLMLILEMTLYPMEDFLTLPRAVPT